MPSKQLKTVPITKRKSTLKNKIICIDPGHGGRDPGAISKHNDYEKKFTLDVSKRLKLLLEKQGAHVIMVRSSDSNPSLQKRVNTANRNGSNLFISIHFNYFMSAKTKGTETYYYKYKDKRLAKLLQKELVLALKLDNRGIKRSPLYVLKHSKMPSALVEPLFITNSQELKKLKQPAFRQQIANALYRGIYNYYK